MAKDFSTMENSNTSLNLTIHDVSRPQRRVVLQGGAASSLLALFGTSGCAATGPRPAAAPSFAPAVQKFAPQLGFKAIAPGMGDTLVVAEGYTANVLAPWGEPVGIAGNMPAFKLDASNSAADQEVQMGMHHDGVHFYAINGSSTRGLLAMNHEYTDDGLLHTKGVSGWSAESVRKSQAAHGVSVIEVEQKQGAWQMVRPSQYARRFTSFTPFAVHGPAAGHALMKTAADPTGNRSEERRVGKEC